MLIGRNRSISTAFTDFGTNNNFIIEGNKFFYYNPMPSSAPYTTGYPRIPTTKYGIGVELTFCYSNVYMEKNTFQGLEYGLVLLPSRKDANVFGSFIDKNKFNSCQTAVYIDEHAVWSFQNNSFTNCGTALTYTNKVYSFLQNVTGNHFYNTPVTGLNIVNATQKKNKYISSTTDDFTNEVVYPSATTTITLGTLPKSLEQQFRGLLIVSAKGNVTSTDPYTTAIYNISYFYTGTSFIGRLSLINQDASSVRVTNIVPSLDLTNGIIKATNTTTEN
ncbi:MAG: hypothetical protein K0Q73_8868 [Paenibacillus sp.]|nr:hypothetical protein [Paenibacillus sp.]